MISSDVFMAVTLLGLWGIVILTLKAPIGYDPKCPECKDRKRRAKEEQAALAHDADHKGWGFKNGAPDVFRCANKECPRNKNLASRD